MEARRDTKRDLELITAPEKIQHLLKNHLAQKSMYVKGSAPPYEVRILETNAHNTITVDVGGLRPEMNDELVLFRILGRYIHLNCVVLGKVGSNHVFNMAVKSASISRKERLSLRVPVNDADVHVSNIRTGKHTIDATLFNIPTSVKVNFSTYEQRMKGMADIVKIDVFSGRGSIFDEVRKTGKMVLVRNAQKSECYSPENEACVDYAAFLEDGLKKKIEEMHRAKIKSEIIVPITYLSHDETRIPLGYIHLQSKTEEYSMDKALELQQLAFEMVDRIRDSNTVLISEKQEVINYSRGGLKVLIRNEELKNYLVRQNGFTFDLFFKMQAPITLYGLIRSAHITDDKNLILGIQISGNSSREGEMKRFMDNVEIQERKMKELLEKRKVLGTS